MGCVVLRGVGSLELLSELGAWRQRAGLLGTGLEWEVGAIRLNCKEEVHVGAVRV